MKQYFDEASKEGYDELFEYQNEQFRNLAIQFKVTNKRTIEDNLSQGYYEKNIDLSDPVLFQRTGVWYRYVINESKKEYIDQVEKITYRDAVESVFPILMAYGRKASDAVESWIGDVLTLSNEKSGLEYKLLHTDEEWNLYYQ